MLGTTLFNDDPMWCAIIAHALVDESATVEALLKRINLDETAHQAIEHHARQLIQKVRANSKNTLFIESFLNEYQLSSNEGIALMCLAESLLRIPDSATRDRLIEDKLQQGDWQAHRGHGSLFVNAATWGLLLTGTLLEQRNAAPNQFAQSLAHFSQRSSRWLVRQAVDAMVAFLSEHFVLAETMKVALKRARKFTKKGYLYSFDRLGEAALTAHDAARYCEAYQQTIDVLAQTATGETWRQRPGLSIKLSALHPRYEMAQRERVLAELTPRLLSLVQAAKVNDLNVTLDAEESDRLTLSLEVFEKVWRDPSLEQWEGFGLAVQAYQKRASPVIDWLQQLAEKQHRRIPVRLTKGAYWDNEIKAAQEQGVAVYPVFSRKSYTDLQYLVCTQQLLAAPHAFYPQFATHNAQTLATVLHLSDAVKVTDFEFQCLHGMGHALYQQLLRENPTYSCRIYAPVGDYHELLPYLVRRLLENGANTSFVHRLVDDSLDLATLVANPMTLAQASQGQPHALIPLPSELYQKAAVPRHNSVGLLWSDEASLQALATELQGWAAHQWQALPSAQVAKASQVHPVDSPIDAQTIGTVVEASVENCEQALQLATTHQSGWDQSLVEQRAQCLERAADLFATQQVELIALLAREAGKTLQDALGEVREAIDFCRYYAALARQQLKPQTLTGPTGEDNQLSLHGRGVIVCISPWNFPLAIFVGQISAALVTGNAVVAKPAEQTPLIAARAVALLHQAGIPHEILQLMPGRGETVGQALVVDLRVAAVMFTGSTATARLIAQQLATRAGPLVPLIAETGGQNAMIVDASALAEQVVQDVILSAFGSAGQRCSALRVLFLQADVADSMLALLAGAMAELRVGDPRLLSTDVGPVIDREAWSRLTQHQQRMQSEAELRYQTAVPDTLRSGTFIAPTVFEISHLKQLPEEVFGPILHVIRYQASQLDEVIQQINDTNYGLTLGIHSRIEQTVNFIVQRVQVGNCYVNRNMIGAVVGVQPFGGQGLSGTGPKAGGPHYLPRLCHERTVSINTTAAGGNATLLSLE